MNKVDFAVEEVLAKLPRRNGHRTLDAARRHYAAHLAAKGARCPCCRRWGKVNGHRLTENLARTLVWLAKTSGPKRKWINVPETAPSWITKTNQHSKLQYWDLVERAPKSPGQQAQGLWRPTKRGVRFTLGRIELPRTAFVYDSEVIGHSHDRVACRDLEGKRFSYETALQDSWLAAVRRKR